MNTLTLDASGHIQSSWYMLHASSQRLHPEQAEKSRAIQIGSTITIHQNVTIHMGKNRIKILGHPEQISI